jgi:hypothetical protein
VLVKDILRVGRFHPPGDDPVEFTHADLRAMARTGNAMLAAGWDVPICVEHRDDAKPTRRMGLAEKRSRGFLSRCVRFRHDADGVLRLIAADPDDAADAKLIRRLRFVSPEIHTDWKTGDGRVWKGPVVTHIALTPTPVNHRQEPFKRLGLAAGVRLSMADYREGSNMAKSDDEVEAEAEKPTADPETPEKDPEAPDPVRMGDGEGGGGDDAELAGAFEAMGLHIPAECLGDLDKLKMALLIAMKTKLNAGGDEAPAEDDNGDEYDQEPTGEPPADAAAAQQPPAMGAAGSGAGAGIGMSLAAASAKLIASGRKELGRRLDALLSSRRINNAIWGDLHAALKTARLSLSAGGDVEPNAVATQIAAYERLPKGAAAGGVVPGRQSAVAKARGVRLSSAVKGPPRTPEEAKDVLDAWQATTRTLSN